MSEQLSEFEIQQRLANLRHRVLRGEELSMEEQREVIALLRGARITASESGTKRASTKKASTVAAIDSDALLNSLL